MNIEVLGSDNQQTDALIRNLQEAIQQAKIITRIKKITDQRKISRYGPLMLPVLVINGNIQSQGRVPIISDLIKMFRQAG